MQKNPKFYSLEFKAKIIKEFIKKDKTQAEICSQYGITVKSLTRWHSEYLESIEMIFTKGKVEKAHKEEVLEK